MALRVRDPLPSLEGAVRWINGPAPSEEDLRDHPVLVHFWSVSCYVCHDVAKHAARWRDAYEPLGMRFIAVHQPRGPEERDIDKIIADAAGPMQITQPAAIDNDLRIVERFDNQFVPAYYIFDRQHRLRHFQAGDKSYDLIEAALEKAVDYLRMART